MAGPAQMDVAQDLLDINLAELEGRPKRAALEVDQKIIDGQHTAQINDEKVKHLKQFICMVDLFNVMEKESK
mgnify:CR=1 FL=1